jgi:hypothetical protein
LLPECKNRQYKCGNDTDREFHLKSPLHRLSQMHWILHCIVLSFIPFYIIYSKYVYKPIVSLLIVIL